MKKKLISFVALLVTMLTLVNGAAFFRNCTCMASTKTIKSDFKCYINTYSPVNATLSIEVSYKRQIFDYSASFLSLKKNGEANNEFFYSR